MSNNTTVSDPSAPSAAEHATPPEDRVPFGQKIALGLGGVTNTTGTQAFQLMAQPIYNVVLGVHPMLVGIALTIPRFWDAFVDPVMGAFSDNFRSRYGRRRPFIVTGGFLLAISFLLVWLVPRDWTWLASWFGRGAADQWNNWATFAYLLVTGILFYTCFSVYSVPLVSLSYEMTPDYHERTRVMAYWGFFTMAGNFCLALYLPLAMSKRLFSDPVQGAQVVAIVVGVVIFIGLGILPGLFVRERFYHAASKQEKVAILPAIWETAQSRPMLVLLGIILALALAGTLAAGLAWYIVSYYVCGGDTDFGSRLNAFNGVGFQIVGFGSIPVISWLATRFSKKTALMVILVLALVGAVAKWFIYTPQMPYLLLLDSVLSGPIWTALAILVPSMMADLCDVDEYQYGKRREGIFGAVFSWMQKFGSSLTFLLAGLVLSLTGFDAKLEGQQPAETLFSMRLFFVGSSVAAMLLAIGCLWLYNISEQRAHEVRAVLEQRRGKV